MSENPELVLLRAALAVAAIRQGGMFAATPGEIAFVRANPVFDVAVDVSRGAVTVSSRLGVGFA